MIEYVKSEAHRYDLILVSSELELGYSFFAFYTPFEPSDFQSYARWYRDGFIKVESYRAYHFTNFPGWEKLDPKNITAYFNDQTKNILVIEKGELSYIIDQKWEIKDWRGQSLWSSWEATLEEATIQLEKLPTNPDRSLTLDYLYSCQAGSCDEEILIRSMTPHPRAKARGIGDAMQRYLSY